jgi:proline dehydrogenase
MSTNPDRIVNAISTWLSGRITNEELQQEIDRLGGEGLAPGQAQAVDELRQELLSAKPDERGDVERVARETLEAVALG